MHLFELARLQPTAGRQVLWHSGECSAPVFSVDNRLVACACRFSSTAIRASYLRRLCPQYPLESVTFCAATPEEKGRFKWYRLPFGLGPCPSACKRSNAGKLTVPPAGTLNPTRQSGSVKSGVKVLSQATNLNLGRYPSQG